MKKLNAEQVMYLREVLSEWTPEQILKKMREFLDEEEESENEFLDEEESEIKWYQYPYEEEKE